MDGNFDKYIWGVWCFHLFDDVIFKLLGKLDLKSSEYKLLLMNYGTQFSESSVWKTFKCFQLNASKLSILNAIKNESLALIKSNLPKNLECWFYAKKNFMTNKAKAKI